MVSELIHLKTKCEEIVKMIYELVYKQLDLG